jgi:hypothetical protein
MLVSIGKQVLPEAAADSHWLPDLVAGVTSSDAVTAKYFYFRYLAWRELSPR